MNLDYANFSGIVYTAACYGADIRNSTPVGAKNQDNSLAMRILSNGSQCFIGSTRTSYSASGLSGNTVIPLTMQEELNKGQNTLAAYFAGKLKYYDLDKTKIDPTNQKMRLQYQYYGIVPTDYWSNTGSTPMPSSESSMSLVFDVSTSRDSKSAYGNSSKISAAKTQGQAFVKSMQNQTNSSGVMPELGVIEFSNGSSVLQGLTDDYSSVNSVISSINTHGNTDIAAGIRNGIAQLENATGSKIMVFLSDGEDTAGNSDDSIISLAKQAKDKDIKIYTIGFGSSSDIDESLLQDIASVTGGTYSHEDPSSVTSAAVGIYHTMKTAQLSSAYEVLSANVGTVAQDATVDAGSFTVPDHGDIHTTLFWPGSLLDLKLVDPAGVEVKEGYPGFSIKTVDTTVQVDIKDAKQGEWLTSVYGAEVSMQEEPFSAITAFEKTEAPAVVATSGGGSSDNGSGMLLLVIVVAIAAIGGLYAYTVRENKADKSKNSSGDGGFYDGI
jgi:hypothetical protein